MYESRVYSVWIAKNSPIFLDDTWVNLYICWRGVFDVFSTGPIMRAVGPRHTLVVF